MSSNQDASDAAPNRVSTVAGSQDTFNRLMDVVIAAANLPPAFAPAVAAQVARGEKVVYYMSTQQITGSTGATTLEAMARVIERTAEVRTYVHFILKESKYRIGPILDKEDEQEVRGCLCLGRQKDSFTDDANGDFFRDSGVPANFSTAPGIPTPIPTIPSYPLVKYRTKSGKVVKSTRKPRNPWILYRVSRHAAVKKANRGLHVSHISSIIKYEWSMMDDEIKTLWYELAENEKLLHKQNYPAYRLNPRKSEEIQRRRPAARKVDVETSVDVDEESNTI